MSNSDEQQQPKLTDEEVWLRAYCASVSNSRVGSSMVWEEDANKCLEDFNKKFRQNERT